MNLSQHAEHIAIAVSNKTMITGAVTTGASLAAEKTGFLAVISTPGPEVVNLCAIIGAAVAIIGLGMNAYFKALRDARERRYDEWRMSNDRRTGEDRRREH